MAAARARTRVKSSPWWTTCRPGRRSVGGTGRIADDLARRSPSSRARARSRSGTIRGLRAWSPTHARSSSAREGSRSHAREPPFASSRRLTLRRFACRATTCAWSISLRPAEAGILEHGCVRVGCARCGFERLVAFSCKRRGFCPSCLGRRMADTAVHLVERVIPEVPVRQWVCSLPWRLQVLLGYDRRLCASAPLRLGARGICGGAQPLAQASSKAEPRARDGRAGAHRCGERHPTRRLGPPAQRPFHRR